MDIKAKLSLEDKEDLILKLGIIPENVNGHPFCKIVRRKIFNRKRITLIKADKPAPNQGENQELWKLCRYFPSHTDVVGFALRSTINGDYYIFSDTELFS